jgi:hypothetical protein
MTSPIAMLEPVPLRHPPAHPRGHSRGSRRARGVASADAEFRVQLAPQPLRRPRLMKSFGARASCRASAPAHDEELRRTRIMKSFGERA